MHETGVSGQNRRPDSYAKGAGLFTIRRVFWNDDGTKREKRRGHLSRGRGGGGWFINTINSNNSEGGRRLAHTLALSELRRRRWYSTSSGTPFALPLGKR